MPRQSFVHKKYVWLGEYEQPTRFVTVIFCRDSNNVKCGHSRFIALFVYACDCWSTERRARAAKLTEGCLFIVIASEHLYLN